MGVNFYMDELKLRNIYYKKNYNNRIEKEDIDNEKEFILHSLSSLFFEL
jgi:hypothetical protein